MSNATTPRLSRRAVLVAAAAAGAGAAIPLNSANAARTGMDAWATISGEVWTIQHGRQQATLVELGGGLLTYTVDGVPFVDPHPLDSPIRPAGRTLAPWPNRIQDGQYTFN